MRPSPVLTLDGYPRCQTCHSQLPEPGTRWGLHPPVLFSHGCPHPPGPPLRGSAPQFMALRPSPPPFGARISSRSPCLFVLPHVPSRGPCRALPLGVQACSSPLSPPPPACWLSFPRMAEPGGGPRGPRLRPSGPSLLVWLLEGEDKLFSCLSMGRK